MYVKRRAIQNAALLLLLSLCASRHAEADLLSLYIESPSTESSYVSDATTETFDGLSTGHITSTYNGAIGTFMFNTTSAGAIQAADQFGGADDAAHPTGGSNYLAIGAESSSSAPVTINLTSSANYFGIWVSAIDSNNGLSIYNGTTLVARISASVITSLLNGGVGTVTAIDGATYSASSYYGNPTAGATHGLDGGEPFVYLDIIDTTGTFNSIVLDNSGTTGTGFETDNYSVYDGPTGGVSPNATSVYVETVPEPSQYMACAGTILALCVTGHRLLRVRFQALSGSVQA